MIVQASIRVPADLLARVGERIPRLGRPLPPGSSAFIVVIIVRGTSLDAAVDKMMRMLDVPRDAVELDNVGEVSVGTALKLVCMSLAVGRLAEVSKGLLWSSGRITWTGDS